MRNAFVVLTAISLSLLLIGCGHSKHRPIGVSLKVQSEHGSPTPPVGSHHISPGTLVNAWVDSPAQGAPGTRYVCTGWEGTGSVPATGNTNLCTFTITAISTITWTWKTQYELTTNVLPAGGGIIIRSPDDTWCDADTPAELSALPNEGYVFTEWSGDLTDAVNPQNLAMNGPKSVTANFLTLPPVAGFSAAPTEGVTLHTVQFTDESTGIITSWQWDFDNDGTVDSTEQSPSYTYTVAGTYTVKLIVTGPGGSDEEIKTDYIKTAGYLWTKRAGGALPDSGYAAAFDLSNNLYITGCFEETVNFAADWGSSESKTSAGGRDIFVTKINSDGSYGWTKRIGGTGDDVGNAVAVDSSGSVYVTGYFHETVDFAADLEDSDNKTSAGYSDIFVTKIGSDGSYGWTKCIGAAGYDLGYAMTVAPSDDVYVTGYFEGTVDFAADWGSSLIKASAGGRDIFVTKINSDSSYGWTKRIGGTGDDVGNAMVADSLGNVYVTGRFHGSVDFAADWGSSDSRTSEPEDMADVFVTKINSNGSYGWTKRIGGEQADSGNAIAADSSGNLYVTGHFRGSVDFAADWEDSDSKTSVGGHDIFVIMMNTDSSYGWAKRIGGTGDDVGNAVAVDSSGSVYVTGYFYGTVDFAADWEDSDSKTSEGYSDIFVTKIESDGSYGWTKRMGGSNLDWGNSIVADSLYSVYITGFFMEIVDFASDWGASESKTSAGGHDIFVTKITSR